MMARSAPIPASLEGGNCALALELQDGVRAGNAEALQALVDLYWEPLLGFAFRMTGCEDTAEDVVQRAFIRFWERRELWRAGSDPKLILYTLVRNLTLNQLGSDRARIRRSADRRMPKAAVPTPVQILDESELLRALHAAIDKLPPRRREALVLARFKNRTHAEIAEVMNLTPHTVTNHISSALAELEVALGPYLAD